MAALVISFFTLILSFLVFISAEKRTEKQKENNRIFDKELIQEWGDTK
jgi:hypothetical protein